MLFSKGDWPAYCEVNRNMAAAVVEQYRDGDLIWVHHFHFMLLPSYLMRKLRGANIGFFMHQPFPTSEIFRCLSKREELLCILATLCVVTVQVHARMRPLRTAPRRADTTSHQDHHCSRWP